MPNILDYLQARAEAAPAPDEVTDAEALDKAEAYDILMGEET